MKIRFLPSDSPFGAVRGFLALLCVVLLVPGEALYGQASPQQQAAPQEQAAPKIPNDQLDSLVAPIALYPDPLLAQMLAASTYPLEIIQLQQWLLKHKDLKDKALVAAVEKEDWDPSVQAMAALPDAVKQLAENIKWTTDLGNAFLAQQGDVMDAVQRMRAKAQSAGTLKSSEQQKVETKVVESKTVIEIQQANPQVVYVPSYNPVVVYGPPVYPYPPIVYPPPPPPGAYLATAAVSFGVGMMVGAAMSGGWGYNCGWGGGGNNTININNNNSFVNNSNRTNVSGGNRTNVSGGNNSWQHNPQHRGGAPYANQATANKFGGAGGGGSTASRQANARQNQGQAGATNRGSAGASSRQQPTASNRGGTGGGSSADRVGNRSAPSGGSSRGGGALGGGSGGYSGSSAKASSSRGSSSMSSRGGGGGGRRR